MKGRKQHIVVDTHGLRLAVAVNPVNIRDPEWTKLGQKQLLVRPRPEPLGVDRPMPGSWCAGPTASVVADWSLCPVRHQHTFALPRPWVVERKTMKDYPRLVEHGSIPPRLGGCCDA